MKKLLFLVLILLNSSLVLASETKTQWGGLGKVEQSQVAMAATFCEIPLMYDLLASSTKVELDSVGYQGVYNYIYSTTLIVLDQFRNPTNQRVIVTSEHMADIDIDPVSYTFKIIKISAPNFICRQPEILK